MVNLFFNYLISLVYKAPDFNAYCPQTQVVKEVNTQEACVTAGGQWNENVSDVAVTAPVVSVTKGYCDLQYTCRTQYDNASKLYGRNIFITLVILGIILVALGFGLAFNLVLSVSASLGGILSIIIASIRYWGDADNLVRVLILFFALLALIYFAVKKFKN